MDTVFCIDNWNHANTRQKIPEILNDPLIDNEYVFPICKGTCAKEITSRRTCCNHQHVISYDVSLRPLGLYWEGRKDTDITDISLISLNTLEITNAPSKPISPKPNAVPIRLLPCMCRFLAPVSPPSLLQVIPPLTVGILFTCCPPFSALLPSDEAYCFL